MCVKKPNTYLVTVIGMCYQTHDNYERIACLTISVLFFLSDLQKKSMHESKTGQRKWTSLRKTSSLSQSMNSKSGEDNYKKYLHVYFLWDDNIQFSYCKQWKVNNLRGFLKFLKIFYNIYI